MSTLGMSWADMVDEEEEEKRAKGLLPPKSDFEYADNEYKLCDKQTDQYPTSSYFNMVNGHSGKENIYYKNANNTHSPSYYKPHYNQSSQPKSILLEFTYEEREEAYAIQKQYEDYPGLAKNILFHKKDSPWLILRTEKAVIDLNQKKEEEGQDSYNGFIYKKVKYRKSPSNDPRWLVYQKPSKTKQSKEKNYYNSNGFSYRPKRPSPRYVSADQFSENKNIQSNNQFTNLCNMNIDN